MTTQYTKGEWKITGKDAKGNAAHIVFCANLHDELVEALEIILNSDMAMREEDEGRTSLTLQKAKALLAKVRHE